MEAYQENLRQLKAEVREQERTINLLKEKYCKSHSGEETYAVHREPKNCYSCELCFIESPVTYRVIRITTDNHPAQVTSAWIPYTGEQSQNAPPDILCEMCCFRTFNYTPCTLAHRIHGLRTTAQALVVGVYGLRPQEETESLLCRNRTKSARK